MPLQLCDIAEDIEQTVWDMKEAWKDDPKGPGFVPNTQTDRRDLKRIRAAANRIIEYLDKFDGDSETPQERMDYESGII